MTTTKTRSWHVNDVADSPIEIVAANGEHVFILDAEGSYRHVADVKLPGPQARALAGILHDAMEAIGTPGVCEWPVENAEDHPIWVRVIDGTIHIVGPGPDWPHPTPPRIVVGGAPHALAWIQLLREAVQELEYQAVFTDAEYQSLNSQ
jgi:hypothetical protein